MRTTACLFLMTVLVVTTGCGQKAQPTPPPSPDTPAADAVSGIPAYPGASQLVRKEEINKDGYARVVEVKLHSTAGFADINAFYASAIEAGGWQVTAREERPDEAEWKLVKGSAVARIELDVKSSGGVEIAIERKDR